VTSVSQFRRPRSDRSWRATPAAVATALLLALSASPPAAAAERMLVTPGSGRHLSAAIVTRARNALLAELAVQCPSCLIMPQHGQPQEAPLGPDTAAALSAELGGQVVVALDLDHRAGLTRFTLVAFYPRRAGTPIPPRVVVESTRAGPDVVGPVVRNLVARLFQIFPEPAPISANPATSRQLFLGFGLGLRMQLDTAARNDQILGGVTLSGVRVGQSSLLDLRVDVAANSFGRRAAVGLSYSVRFGERWSLGLASTWVWMNLGGRGANGAAVEPIVGYRIGGSPVRIEAGYSLNLFKEQVEDRLIPGSDARYWSHGPRLLVGALL
jgi:hypothetical protein